MPKWTQPNPGDGKHGVPDKDAHKLGRKWGKKPKEAKKPAKHKRKRSGEDQAGS